MSTGNFIHSVRQQVEQNLDNHDFSIEQLCREMGISRTHLHRKIKSATGLSTSLYIRKVRLEKARVLLETTDYNISEVAYLTGNKSPQNFSKYFIEEFGLSPSAYRKQRKAAKAKRPIPESKTERLSRSLTGTAHRAVLIFAILSLLAVLGFAFKDTLLAPVQSDDDHTAEQLPSIAVIPFQHYGPADGDFFSEGVVEDILTYLTQFEGLKVLSGTSAEKFRDSRQSMQQIGNELGVEYMLEGSVRQDSSRVIISAQLIQVSDNQHIWAERYEKSRENVFELQTEIARTIAAALNQSISTKAQQRLDRIPTNNVEAYTALLRGRHLLRSRTKEDLYKSLEQFERAIKLDPEYAEAYAGLAEAYYLLPSLRYVPEKKERYWDTAEQHALTAIKYDKNSGSAYAILANLYMEQYRWEEAISAFEIALSISPNDALINYWFSLILRSTGNLERSLRYHKIAADLDPLHPVIQAGYIYTCSLAGEYELAEDLLKKVEPVLGESFLYYAAKANLLLRKGEYRAAIPVCDKALALNPAFTLPESDKYYCLGKLQEKEAVMQYVLSLDTSRALDCLKAAKVYSAIDSTALSLRYLSRAASLGLISEDLLVNPIYRPIRTHPIYTDILKQYNLYAFFSPM